MSRLGRSLIVASAIAVWLAGGAARAESTRFALFVGSNLGDRHEPVLHHAEDDALRLAQTMRTLGDVPGDQLILLNAVTAAELRDTLIRLNARMREQPGSVLLVFYSGHADAESLHLAGTHFPLAELKALLVGSPATSRLLVVDACRSGSLIGLKGARPAAAFSVATVEEPVPEGFAVLTSSTATEAAQESAALGGSFFTYYLNSGLIGAADLNHDGAVTLSEIYAFASTETRAATVSSPVGPQTPTFQFMLGGRHDLVLTRPGRRDARLGAIQFATAGRYVVQRWEAGGLSPPIAELGAADPGATLALPPGRYRVTLRGEREIAERDATVTGGETAIVNAAAMTRVDLGRVVRKGGVRASATGAWLAAGWRFDETGDWSLALGSGPMGLVAVRHDRRRFSLEARAAVEREVAGNDSVKLENLGLAATAALLFPVDWKHVTLSLGLEAGVVFIHQTAVARSSNISSILPADPSTLKPHWSDGLQIGPLAQVDFPVSEKLYVRWEVALPFRAFGGSPGWPESTHQRGYHFQMVAGAGAAF